MRVKAFPALVPAPGLAAELASVPYDVINTEEASALAEGKAHSFLRVERAELELPVETDPYTSQDVMATVCKALGISLETTFTSKSGRPMKIANGGKVIKELFA